MKLIFISDTHSKHDFVKVPDGDIVFHAGDFSGRGLPGETQVFLDWFSGLPHRHKVLIAGNHDFIAERQSALFREMLPRNIVYLEDSGCEIEGIRIWGSPIQPWFFDWAFNRQRGAEIRRHWEMIPEDTDILLTHGPPYGILDVVARDGRPVGCRDLLKRCRELNALKINAFGHIHEGQGSEFVAGTLFLNVSVLDENYTLKNRPTVVEWRSRDDFELV